MDTYYIIRIFEADKEALERKLIELHQELVAAHNEKGANCTERVLGYLYTATEHTMLDQVYEYEAKHTFNPGDKVQVEAEVVQQAGVQCLIKLHHLVFSPGEVIAVNSANVYHMEEEE